MTNRLLLTGGTGFLGLHVSAIFRKKGWQVYPLGRSDGDLRSSENTRHLIHHYQPDLVVHLAASCGGIGANMDRPAEFFRDNILMGVNVIDECLHANVPRLIVAGSICSYPLHPPMIPFVEETLWHGYPETTNAAYGIAKKSLLVMLEAYRQQHGQCSCYLMPTNMYGEFDNFDLQTSHVIPAMIRKMLEAKEADKAHVDLWGTGQATRDFLYAPDAAEAFYLASQAKDVTGPLNLGSGYEISMKELSERIAKLVGFDGNIHWHKDQPDGQPRRVLDSSKAYRDLGWQASTELDDGLARTIQWWKTHQGKPPTPRQEMLSSSLDLSW